LTSANWGKKPTLNKTKSCEYSYFPDSLENFDKDLAFQTVHGQTSIFPFRMTLSCSASIYFANDFPNEDIIGSGDLMAERLSVILKARGSRFKKFTK
jgi:hypothetical protein